MLLLYKDMLLPEGVEPAMIEFMDSERRPGEDTPNNSKERWIIVADTPGHRLIYEGYLAYLSTGEMRYRANSGAYSRNLHLYAWDNVIAMVPSNKRVKKFWLHPDIRERLDNSDIQSNYYNKYYKERVEACIKISQRT
jgi:hypothetical protein